MENILEETRFIMKKYNIKANKKSDYGYVIKKIVLKKMK